MGSEKRKVEWESRIQSWKTGDLLGILGLLCFEKQTKAIATVRALFDVKWINLSLLYFPIIPQTYIDERRINNRKNCIKYVVLFHVQVFSEGHFTSEKTQAWREKVTWQLSYNHKQQSGIWSRFSGCGVRSPDTNQYCLSEGVNKEKCCDGNEQGNVIVNKWRRRGSLNRVARTPEAQHRSKDTKEPDMQGPDSPVLWRNANVKSLTHKKADVFL